MYFNVALYLGMLSFTWGVLGATGACRLGMRTMSTLIRTDQVSAADRIDFVREMTATTWVPMDCRALGERAGYVEEFRASGLGAMQVVVMDIMPITVCRTPELISQADPDMLKMVLVCGGNSCVVEQDGREAPCRRASSPSMTPGAPTRWRAGSAETGRRR